MTEVKASVPWATPATGDDLPRLFEEFSRVTANLAASHEVLLEQVGNLKRELAAKDRRLERKKRLEALGRVAAGVAHEFRNPLGGIRLTVDALLRDDPNAAAQRRLCHIRRALEHLDQIVGDLLTFTRSEKLELELVSPRELVRGAVELAFPEASPAELPLIAEGAEDVGLRVDRRVMTQVLVNLLANARHAVGEGKPACIGVWWGVRESRPWIEVADDGSGIPEGEEEMIFHPFHSLREGGTGLGLAIVHSRIEAHEGEISVVSDSWGGGESWRGARFRMLFPPCELGEGY